MKPQFSRSRQGTFASSSPFGLFSVRRWQRGYEGVRRSLMSEFCFMKIRACLFVRNEDDRITITILVDHKSRKKKHITTISYRGRAKVLYRRLAFCVGKSH